ncbi:hypothetical protein HQ531_03970 [bacterium]|nr:hypothetical protein [bacterium]
MKNSVDPKSVLIGILSTTIFFLLVSAKQNDSELGDVSVSSLTVRDNGSIRIISGTGDYSAYMAGDGPTGATIVLANALGIPSVSLGTNFEGQGGIVTYNQEGKVSSHVGTGSSGEGFFRTFNKREAPTTYLGGSTQGGGQLTTYNEVGNETVFLGTGSEGIGFLRTGNEYGKMSVYVGTGKSNTGMILLCDRDGKTQWVEKVDSE